MDGEGSEGVEGAGTPAGGNTDSSDAASTSSPDTAQTPTPGSDLVNHLRVAGKAELEAIKPMVAKIVRSYVKQYEEVHMKGLVGMVERRIVDAVVDGIFGPPPAA